MTTKSPATVPEKKMAQQVGSSGSSATTGETKEKKKADPSWLQKLYSTTLFDDEELAHFYDTVRFIGFDRDTMLAELQRHVIDPKLSAEAVILCALRGPRKAENIKLSNGKTLKQMGIPASDQKGTQNLSCQRISSATADLAAFYLKKLNFPGRSNFDLPGWLQFPTAGSIKMPKHYRDKHREFNKWFSERIGGSFNEDIYNQMEINSYIDENLQLFV